MADIAQIQGGAAPEASAVRRMLRAWAAFVAIGLVLYAGLYAAAESRVRATGETNRFHQVWSAPPQTFDHVILGASHAMPLGFGGMEEALEEASGTSIMNLSNEGAGVVVNAFVLDHFLRRHEARHVIYVVDSFAFGSEAWNEVRLGDGDLFDRAPLDGALVATLLDHPRSWPVLPGYLSGFAKVNALFRLGPDRTEAELTRFDRTWRPIEQIDAQRIDYLYADRTDEAIERYLAELRDLIGRVQGRGATFTAVKPPTPSRYRDRLPDEAEFDRRLSALLSEAGARLLDHSKLLDGDEFYYDTDHLNRVGVEAYAGAALVPLLRGD